MMTHLSSFIDIKGIEDQGLFWGYASVFDVIDRQKDMVAPGAFQQTLKQWQSSGRKPKMLWQHDVTNPIGIWHEIQENDHGLYVKGQLLLELTQSREAYTLLKEGGIEGLSIGYRPVKTIPMTHGKGRILQEVELHEISLVTFAANPAARVMAVKNWTAEDQDLMNRLDLLGDLLRGFTMN
jgi:HK97 family phage prohead protease